MKVTARFELQRHKELKALFTKERLVTLWRKLVKDQVRSLDIRDLYDYYDFNYSIENKVDEIVEKILSGTYRAEAPLIYRSEKKFGVCRHLMVPSPSDALVFQVLTDELYGPIIDEQPSKGAFYSRDRHSLSLPHEQKEASSYPWFILWPKFQKEIWEFSKSYKYLVVTDLTNYFDNIGLRELRHIISAIAKTKEVYLDLLFSLIEDLSWNPDYLPTSNKGLPTINIEATRLLAHALLFEVDYVLKEKTKDSFVRWMDDINFGANQKRDAHQILGEVNDVLKSRGLALNLAKTAILDRTQAEEHFLFHENIKLSKFDKKAQQLKGKKEISEFAKEVDKDFKGFVKNCKSKSKDKITKRYFTVMGRLGSPRLLKHSKKLFNENPGLRDKILSCFEKVTFTKARATYLLKILDGIEWLDEVTLFKIVQCATRWEVPFNKSGKWFVDEVGKRLNDHTTPFGWFCWIHFLAKYGQPHETLTAVAASKKFGAKEPFYARQAMAVLPRALSVNKEKVRELWHTEISTGISDSASVANNLLLLMGGQFPAKNHRLYFYLFPQKKQNPYPIAKFLILCALAAMEKEKDMTIKRPVVVEHVSDPWYLHWLKEINPVWFK